MAAELISAIDEIYDCVGTDFDHQRCLSAIGRTVDGTSLSLGEAFPFLGRINIIASYNVPEDSAKVLVDSFSTIESNSFLKNLPKFPKGVPFLRRAFVSDEDHYQSDLYRRASEPWGIHSEGATVLSKGLTSALFCGFFRLPERRTLDIQDLSRLCVLNKHYLRALEFQDRFSKLEMALLRTNDILDLLDFGVIIFGETAVPDFINQSARRILANSRKISLSEKGLAFSDPKSQRDYDEKFKTAKSAMVNPEKGTGGLVKTAPSPFRRPYNIVVQPMSIQASNIGRSSVCVFIFDPSAKRTTAIQLLSESYGLTKKETQLALHLAQGLSVEDYAKSHGVSINTVRTHVRSIYAKTNTTRQPELVSLILRLTAGLNLV